jgi:hypothetical protein
VIDRRTGQKCAGRSAIHECRAAIRCTLPLFQQVYFVAQMPAPGRRGGKWNPGSRADAMSDFEQLVASRKHWIAEVLIPWCRSASLKDLQRAEREWKDIAGKGDPPATLWR